MTGGLRRCAVLVVLVGAGVLVIGAQAASAQVIEICKSSSNGMSGRDFSYSVAPSGGSSFSVGVKGGRCSGPITVTGASATITEAVSDPATDVKSVTVRPSARKMSEDLANRKVTVQTGASTASETLVTFTNQPAGGNYGSLKVCKLTETPAYLGRQFSFSVNGGPIVSTEANDAFDDPANYTCRILGTFQVGSVVNVHEQIPAGSEVQWIDTDPGENLLDFNTASGDATIAITAGMTIVYYDNEPTPPTGTGWLEVCKNASEWSDREVWGEFDFTVTDAAGATHELSVLAGQCSEPIQVAAGVNLIEEHATTNTVLTDVDANPEDRLLTVNLINRSATVEVPVSDSPNDETQVNFENELLRGQLKVCKALGPGSTDLIGRDFYFSVRDLDGPALGAGVEITAAATTQCKIEGFFPIGHTIDVREDLNTPGTDGVGLDEAQYIDVSGEGQVVIKPGVNTITITNTATGRLEVCKAAVRFRGMDDIQAAPAPIKQPTFRFKIDNGAYFNVQAGKCSMPKKVSVGNHTVTEVNESDYELDPDAPGGGITVFPADREVSKSLATRTVTVSVPWGVNGETLVTFYNRVKLAKIKVCKVIPIGSTDALGMKDFTFDVNGETLGPIKPGECTFTTRSIPILSAPESPTGVVVTELNQNPAVFGVTNITVSGARAVGGADLGHGIIKFNPGPGVNVVTYENTARDP
jgi:hypothetical protein